MTFDPTTIPAAVVDRLTEDYVLWLTTVNASGEPTPTPVWFVWFDGEVWIRSQPEGAKIDHLAANPHVALNLNSDRTGGDVVVLNGAGTAQDAMPDAAWEAYVAKYDQQISGLGFTPESFAASYAVPIHVTPSRLRHW
ncbi:MULTISPECIES: TIGR03667 family PPOX class F420-dependent oxidoreductase [Mumia]|uniref:TIGR03667 family PPOX class F420-dependent oxidoreductase n=1 Tax=Mumia TaxID=1546255 RepID=UPI00142016DC|nr:MULTISPECIES: TIGR03667 family PPOX class F420-dependent oxidoreductase [unclassified Mumia]QMW65013.1 TIGR03667 family PPOX class F420-dependent oxidoreductase [Mumia sp. ZJ1417]